MHPTVVTNLTTRKREWALVSRKPADERDGA